MFKYFKIKKKSKTIHDQLMKCSDHYRESYFLGKEEGMKQPIRTEVINYILSRFTRETRYLEIGVRNPEDNFNHIKSDYKYSVDPGVEYAENPVDFKMTSDSFFEQLSTDNILSSEIRFDVIFIDGLHLADQTDRDIKNSLNYLNPDGFVVIHDCNPPTEWHARENFSYSHTPATIAWNGTTWKAFVKWRSEPSLHSCCVDTEWGIGILSKVHSLGKSISNDNPFYEYEKFSENRNYYLNLVSHEQLKEIFNT